TTRLCKAEQSYFFDAAYFTELAKSLGPVLKLFVLKTPDGEVISGGLFTLCARSVQYHLGGTRNTALKFSPMVLILETVRHWANQNGAHTFHLGGGVGAKSDSLFHFKARFSRQRHKFATWRWIVEPEAYRELSVRKHVWNSERGLKAISPSFFPAYRCPAEPVGEQQFFAKKTAAPCAATPRPDSGGLRVLTTNQREEWTGAVQRARQYDFYFLPEYHAFAERCGNGEARLFGYEQAGYTISLPLIIRTLAGLPGIGGWANRWRDGMSVYGYSGPLYSHEDMPPTVIGGFQRALRAALQELQVVSVFSRLHPLLLAQSTLLDGLGDRQPEGVT